MAMVCCKYITYQCVRSPPRCPPLRANVSGQSEAPSSILRYARLPKLASRRLPLDLVPRQHAAPIERQDHGALPVSAPTALARWHGPRRRTGTTIGLAELGQGVIAQAIGIALARLRKRDDVLGDDRVGAVAPFFKPKSIA